MYFHVPPRQGSSFGSETEGNRFIKSIRCSFVLSLQSAGFLKSAGFLFP